MAPNWSLKVRLNDYGDNQFEISTQAIKTTIEPDVQIMPFKYCTLSSCHSDTAASLLVICPLYRQQLRPYKWIDAQSRPIQLLLLQLPSSTIDHTESTDLNTSKRILFVKNSYNRCCAWQLEVAWSVLWSSNVSTEDWMVLLGRLSPRSSQYQTLHSNRRTKGTSCWG